MSAVDQAGLDALPDGAVIKTDHGIYLRSKPRHLPDEWGWLKQGTTDTYPRIYLKRTAYVLYNPDESDDEGQASDEDVRATTERVAKVILEEVEPGFDWESANKDHRELYREVARAAIRAMMPE